MPLSRAQIRRYRHTVVGRHRVRTKAAALRFVNAVGFCYAFTSGPGELPALFDVLDTRSINRMWSWAWQWKDELASERHLFYGRIVRRKPTLISLAYVPHFFALTGNVGEPDPAHLGKKSRPQQPRFHRLPPSSNRPRRA